MAKTPDPDTLPVADLLFVIQESPKGFEGKYVVRRWIKTLLSYWVVGDLGAPFGACDTLDAARQCIPEGKAKLPSFRSADDRTVREVWL